MAEKILIISPVPLFPGHAGNRERIRAICTELMQRGYTLDFFYAGFDEMISDAHSDFFNGGVLEYAWENEKVKWTNPVRRVQEIMNGYKVKVSRWHRYLKDGSDSAKFNRSLYGYRNFGKIGLLEKQVKKGAYKAVIINYAPYSFYFDFFDEQVIKIVDTHDRLTDRFTLFSENNQTPVNWHSLRFEDEQRALSKADTVWAITDKERDFFKTMLSDENVQVHTLRHLIPFKQIENQTLSKTIVLIGSTNRLNIDGLTWFLEQVWRKITHYEFDLKFMIAGSICEAVDENILDESVQLYGRFDSPEEIYSKGDLFINPMREGTGLKIKTFEALANGKFVLSTKAGATGLKELIGHGLICSDDPAIWIREIKNFFTGGEKRSEEAGKKRQIIEKIYRENLEVITESLALKNA